MADHGTVEYATATGNDMAAHEPTYARFVHLAFVGTLHVVNIAIGLAVGGGAGCRGGVAGWVIVRPPWIPLRPCVSDRRASIALRTFRVSLELSVTG